MTMPAAAAHSCLELYRPAGQLQLHKKDMTNRQLGVNYVFYDFSEILQNQLSR